MTFFRTSLITLLLGLASANALADDQQTCPDKAFDILGKALNGSSNDSDDAEFTAAACKVAPWDSNILIAAVAYGVPTNDDSGNKTLLTATIDLAKGKILQSEKIDDVGEDAATEYGDGSLSIDTARYQLAPDVRAFGVRFNSTARGPSCADNNTYDELTLYVPRQKALVPVFTANMASQTALEGCLGGQMSQDVWELAKLSISLEKTSSHGYADLRITANIEPDTDMDKPPKKYSMKKRVESTVLKYNGKEYPVPSFSDAKHWWLTQ